MEKVNFKKEKIPFTQVANEVLNDPNLSAKAKGLYAYLYSKPSGWDFAIDRIAREFTDGRRSINHGLQELEQNGYLLRERQGTGRVLYILKSQMSKMDIRGSEPNVQNSKVLKQQSAEMDTVSNKEVKVINSISNKESTFTPKQENISFFEGNEKYHEIRSLLLQHLPEQAVDRELQKFVSYWTEPNSTGKKQRWEMQKTFDVKRRLRTWLDRASTDYKNKSKGKGIIV